MESVRDRIRMNLEGDRLSRLPDDLIHKILSFNSIKDAVQTSAISSRWRYVWTSLPYLNFSSKDFKTLRKFSNCVTGVLSGRNDQIEVTSVKLVFRGSVSQMFVKEIMEYAFSHNIQQLSVECLDKKEIEFHLSLFRCHSLKHLTLTGSDDYDSITLISTWDLPALTTLHLNYVTIFDDESDEFTDIFLKCANLKNLTLKGCRTVGLNGFKIFHPQLTHLTLEDGDYSVESVDVVTPQLENLIIRDYSVQYSISAPKLGFFLYYDHYPLQLFTDGFPSLEKVDICISHPNEVDAHKIVYMLDQLNNVESLVLNMEIIEVLSLFMELIPNQPSPFSNLKSLKIYPLDLSKAQINMSTKVKNYLLDSSPGAALTMVSREDARAVRDTISAQSLMTDLQVLLDKVKANMETNMAHIKRRKVQVEKQSAQPDINMQLAFEERMVEVESYWKVLNVEFKECHTKIRTIISMLRKINELLTKLPISQQTKMELRFSNLRVEAETIMNNMRMV